MPTTLARKDWPWATSALVLVTAVAEVLQVTVHGYADALRRDPAGLSTGHWWRVLTALLAQTDGVWQFAVNIVALALIGYGAERLVGRWRFVVAYLAGGIVGQVLGYFWELPGGGNSVAVLGVAGALVVAVLRGQAAPPVSLLVSWYLAAALCGHDVGSAIGGSLGAGIAAAVLLGGGTMVYQGLRGRGPEAARRGDVVLAVLVLAAAVVMAAFENHHGPAVLTGAAIGLLAGQPARGPEEGRKARGPEEGRKARGPEEGRKARGRETRGRETRGLEEGGETGRRRRMTVRPVDESSVPGGSP